MPKDAKVFLCVWGSGFPNTYRETIRTVSEDFFSDALGYDQECIDKIKSLQEGESIGPDNCGIDGGHIITRLMNGFTLDLEIRQSY